MSASASFIAMDPPRHDEQRRTVSPIVAPANLALLEGTIRERVCTILDNCRSQRDLRLGRARFDRTDHADAGDAVRFSVRRPQAADLVVRRGHGHPEGGGPITTEEQRQEELGKCLAYFTRLWNERVNAPPRNDLISMMAHSPATRQHEPSEFLGNLVLLIVGGNDTTRNSISGGLLALLKTPASTPSCAPIPA
jgi:cytochrome P450